MLNKIHYYQCLYKKIHFYISYSIYIYNLKKFSKYLTIYIYIYFLNYLELVQINDMFIVYISENVIDKFNM